MAKKYPNLGPNLKRLLFQKDMKSVDLARAVSLPAPTVHRLVTGKSTRPYESSLKPIADFFQIDIEQLLGEKPLPASEHENTVNPVVKSQITDIPLIPWDQLSSRESHENFSGLPFVGQISELGFATIMPDSSMEPLFQRDSILIFDPQLKPTDRGYALIKLRETGAYILRQLLVDAEHQYLKPLNPDLSAFTMRLLNKNDEIIGSLIETRHNFRPESNVGQLKELKP